MYPHDIFWEIDLYTVFLCVGIIAAIAVFRILADRLGISAKLHNFSLVTGVGAITLGYFSAVLFQALYNIEKNGGQFILNKSTGATFYGGLIGGAAVFLAVYFAVGHFIFPDRQHTRSFYTVADIAMCSVSVGHALGRIGCLMAGCCYGRATDAWYGIPMLIGTEWQRVVPTQLFEAIFLFGLFGFFLWRVLCKKGYCLELYMCVYGVWRFFIEYLRNDYRGTTFVSALTPSQLIAILMAVGGTVLIFVRKRLTSKASAENDTYE